MPNANNWGGSRPGAGRKKKPLAEKLQEGRKATVVKFPEQPPEPDMPDIKAYLSDEQRIGELYARDIYEETWKWLKDRGCVNLINPHMLELYSMSLGRWRQAESIISQYGPINKQFNGEVKISPFVAMAQNYLREARTLWNEIWYIVQSNCSETITDNPNEDMMEKLLTL